MKKLKTSWLVVQKCLLIDLILVETKLLNYIITKYNLLNREVVGSMTARKRVCVINSKV